MGFFTSVAGLYVLQVLVHAGILLVAVETLLRVWSVHSPATRAQFRYLCLLLPLLGWPLFQVMYPARGSEQFRAGTALIDTRPWLSVEVGGAPVWALFAGAMALGTGLFVARVLVPTVRGHILAKMPANAPPLLATGAGGENPVPGSGNLLGAAARLVDEPWTAAQLRGFRCPRLVVSDALVDVLDHEELGAVLAHEEAHARRGDNRWGWLQFLLGLAAFYNPLSLIASHRVSQDIEMACDDEAAGRTGRPLALASALMKATRLSLGAVARKRSSVPVEWLSRLEDRVLVDLVTQRVRRLTSHNTTSDDIPLKRLKLVMTALACGVLLFFVV